MSEPGKRSLDHIAEAAQPRTMCLVAWTSQLRRHAAPAGFEDVDLPAVASVAQVGIRSKTRSPAGPDHGRDGVEKIDGKFAVGNVGRRGPQGQGKSVRIGDQMAFAALLAAIRGVRPRVRPPKTARNDALSATTRDKLMRSFLPRWRRIRRHSLGHTPASVQSRNRRQQVGPLGASSAGIWFQPQPVRRTNRMPTRHRRSAVGGRPPFGRGGR